MGGVQWLSRQRRLSWRISRPCKIPGRRPRCCYPLPELLLLLLCGTVAGADDFVELALRGGEHLSVLRRFLPFAHGIPSHDTLCEVVAALDPALFKTCFANWVERLRDPGSETIAIDGKTSRRSHARSQGRSPLPYGFGLGDGATARIGPGSDVRKVQRDHCRPLLLQRLGHHRRHGNADRHCPDHSRGRRGTTCSHSSRTSPACAPRSRPCSPRHRPRWQSARIEPRKARTAGWKPARATRAMT